MKITNIEMEWTDSGAVVRYESGSLNWDCPRCQAQVAPGTEHRCGDKVTKKAPRKAGSR